MAHGWNTLCHTQLTGVISNSEDHHNDDLTGQDTLSKTLVSQEALSSGCNLNSNTILDFVQQNNSHGLPWNDEVAPGPLLGIQGSLLEEKSGSVIDVGVNSNTQDTKLDTVLLSSSALEQYSDVSSCSELDIDRTISPCVELKSDCNHHSVTQESENTWELGHLALSFSSLHPKPNSQNSMKAISANLDVKGNIDPKQDISGSNTSENHLCCHERSLLSKAGDLTGHPEAEEKEHGKDTLESQEDQYSNISSPLEFGREQSLLREDEEIDGGSSTTQVSDGSYQTNTLDCQVVSGEPPIRTSAIETNALEKDTHIPDGNYNGMVCYDNMSGKESVPSDGEKENNDLSFKSATECPQISLLEMGEKRQFNTDSVTKEATHKDRENDFLCSHNSEGERSSFEFLERCLGLKETSTASKRKTSPGKEVQRLTDNETTRSSDGKVVDETEREHWIPQAGPPTLAPVDLESTFREEVSRSSYSRGSDQEPPVLSICLGKAVTNLGDENLEETEENEQDGDPNFVELISPQDLKKSLHPIVLLKDSTKSRGYRCADCPQQTQSLFNLIDHHHCVHSQHNIYLCQTCECYFTDDNLAIRHQCDQKVDTARSFIPKTTLQHVSSKRPQESQQEGKGIWRILHKCQYCSQTFHRLYEFHKHQRKHTGITPFKCVKCGVYYSQSSSLNRHKRLNRCRRPRLQDAAQKPMSRKPTSSSPKEQGAKLVEVPAASPQVKLIDCYVKLVDYRKKNQPPKSNCCQICGKTFRLRAQLISHRRSHTDERPFKCHNCLKAFKYACNLYRHKKNTCTSLSSSAKCVSPLKSLVGEYKCPLCRGVFKYSYTCFRHMRKVCLKEYSRQGKGKVGNVYKCALCSSCFANASNRSRHIKATCMKEYVRRESLKVKRDYLEQRKILLTKEQQKPPQQKTQLTQPQQNNSLRHKCNFCPATFAHASGKYKHMRKHKLHEKMGKPIKYRTSINFSLNPEKTEDTAKMSNSNDSEKDASCPSFICRFCGKCFHASFSLKKHMRLHNSDRPYHCQECGKRFMRRSHLITHKNVHQRRIQCTVCKKILPTISELIKHRQAHNKKGMLQCPDCSLQFKYPAFLLRHVRTHNLMQHKSPQSRDPLLSQHPHQSQHPPQQEKQQQQDKAELFRCCLCQKVFTSSKELSKHCLTHMPKQSINQCPVCKRHFCSRNALIRHIRLHTGEKPYRCHICGKCFSRNEALKVHQEKCFETLKDPVLKESEEREHMSAIPQVEKIYSCQYCPQTFVWPCSLSKHKKNHMLKILIPCSKCGKCYKKLKLQSHEKVCNLPITKKIEASRFQLSGCGKCGQTFCRPYNRTIHERRCKGSSSVLAANSMKNGTKNRTRSIDKPKHRCPHCPKAFRYRCYLLRHIVVHTRDKKYECMHCGRKYANCQHYLEHEAFCDGFYQSDLSRRRAIRNRLLSTTPKSKGGQMTKGEGEGEYEYKCKFCTKSFMKSRNLRRHILTHTEVKPYRCKTCESCFSRYDHLKLHQNRCKGKRQRLEVRIFKLNLEDLRKDLQKKPEKPEQKEGKMFECSSCSKCFSNKINLARHVALQHTTVKPFCCNFCGTSFSHRCSLKKHNLKCNDGMFSSSKALSSQQEIQEHSPRESGTDKPCRETSKLLIRIQKHYLDKRKYVCAYCPRRFKNKEQLTVHTRLHTGEKPFGCANCGERFIRRDYLKRHLIKCKVGRESAERVLCDRCGDLYFRDQLRSHQKGCVVTLKMRDHQAKDLASQSASPKKSGFFCANCDARFLLFSQLQQHFLTTHREDTYQQLQNSPSPLQQQLSIGSVKEEPMDEGYEVNQLRNSNILAEKVTSVSTGSAVNKPFVCPYCNLRFCNNSGLGMHLRTHSSSFPFFCQRCQRGFWSKNTLRKHYRKCRFLQIVTKEEPNTEIPNAELPTPIDSNTTVKNTVLVFNSGSKTTGTGVLQTNFSCKEGNKEKLYSVEVQNKWNSPSTAGNAVHKFQCSECDQSFTDGLLLISHLEDHGRKEQEQKKGYRCNQCGKVFSQPGVLSRHFKMHKSIKMPYACPECPKSFRCPSDLDVHRSCHDPSRPCVCSFCHERFFTNASLSRHTTVMHKHTTVPHPPRESTNIFACQYCDKAYSIKSSYQKHCRIKHHKQWREKLLNDQTKGAFPSKPGFDLAVDIEEENPADSDGNEEDDNGDDDSDSAPYFPCHVCGKTFNTSESLEDHQRCHLGEKPHECEECGKCFFQLSNLQQHQRSHKSEFQCQTCGRGFVSLFALRKHKHTHGKNRPHRCPKCQLSFTGLTQLAEHMATHRDENFPCDLCDCTFTCKLSRAEHRKSHIEPEDSLPPLLPPQQITASSSNQLDVDQLKYRCGICCERFRDPEQLSEHGCLAAIGRPYSCPDCNQHFLCGSHLKKHQLSHQISRAFLYQCNRCHMCFSYRHHFLNHLKRHGTEEADDVTENLGRKSVSNASGINLENIYKCPICPYSFSHALELAEHLSVHAESTYTCKVCNERFLSKSSLMEHEQCHLTATTQYECTECGDSFLGSDTFRQHYCAHQQCTASDQIQPIAYSSSSCLKTKLPSTTGPAAANNTVEDEEVDVGEDFYDCPFCTKRFSSQLDLEKHQRHHVDYRPFKCLVCGKCFAQKRYLKKHQLIHQRRYRCNMCPQSFGNSKAYKIHQDLHHQKSQKCSVSNQDISPHRTTHLKHAKEDLEDGGNYRCDMCYKSFSQLSSLRRHQETHVGEVVYECTECDKAFAFFHLLEQHQSSHVSSASLVPSSSLPDGPLSSPVTE